MEGRNGERAKREIDYVLLSAFGIIGGVLSSQTRQSELTLQGREEGGGGDLKGARGQKGDEAAIEGKSENRQ